MSQLRLSNAGGSSTRKPSTSSSSGGVPHLYETISRERWVEAIRRLVDGHEYRGQGSGAAVRNLTGCLIAQKAGNRKDKGYVQVDPPYLTVAHRSEPKIAWQSAHRILCYLYKGPEDVRKLLYEDNDGSHLCHMSKCINIDHLHVETHDDNMARRECEEQVDVVTIINGKKYLLPNPNPCPHNPRCINQRQLREAYECKEIERGEEKKQQEEKEDSDVICLD